LREIGLGPGLRALAPTAAGVVAALSAGDLRGRRIGVQLYPEADSRLVDFLAGAGAAPDPVLPYAYVPAGDPAGILALIDEIGAGRVDVVAFTSASQVSMLFDAARAAGKEPELCSALRRTAVAAVGPVVAGELQRRGIPVAAMPRDTFFMKPLVSAIAAFLSP
jgi:uroporphyrinogen-III synthase